MKLINHLKIVNVALIITFLAGCAKQEVIRSEKNDYFENIPQFKRKSLTFSYISDLVLANFEGLGNKEQVFELRMLFSAGGNCKNPSYKSFFLSVSYDEKNDVLTLIKKNKVNTCEYDMSEFKNYYKLRGTESVIKLKNITPQNIDQLKEMIKENSEQNFTNECNYESKLGGCNVLILEVLFDNKYRYSYGAFIEKERMDFLNVEEKKQVEALSNIYIAMKPMFEEAFVCELPNVYEMPKCLVPE